MCGEGEESLEHISLECPFNVGFWYNSEWQFRIQQAFTNQGILGLMYFLLNLENSLPLSIEEKERFLNFGIVGIEMAWLMRDKIAHGEPQHNWEYWMQLVQQLGGNLLEG